MKSYFESTWFLQYILKDPPFDPPSNTTSSANDERGSSQIGLSMAEHRRRGSKVALPSDLPLKTMVSRAGGTGTGRASEGVAGGFRGWVGWVGGWVGGFSRGREFGVLYVCVFLENARMSGKSGVLNKNFVSMKKHVVRSVCVTFQCVCGLKSLRESCDYSAERETCDVILAQYHAK